MNRTAWRKQQRTLIQTVGLAFGLLFEQIGSAAPPTAEQLEFFETRIRPVLVEQCYSCHNSVKQSDGELRLDSRAGLLKGGDSGVIVVPGKPKESRLLPILRHEVAGLKMPQGGAKFDERTVADFEKWIAMGAPDPRDNPPTAEELAKSTSWDALVATRKHWWSLRPIENPPLPSSEDNRWSDHPIDRFVLARLRDHKLNPSARAEPRVLVRRIFFALTGLPPSTEQAEYWAARVHQPEGFEALADHLLQSPQFGERWARHWMDWIRYCDSHGSEGDPAIENGWHYRDYLIRALNNDIPFDQLVREHLAGDLLKHPRMNNELGINESLIATAHWRMVFHGFAPTDALDEKVRFIDDELNTFSKAFLGLTVSCARCHDHKFDAISQKDYYALFAIFSTCRPGRTAIDLPGRSTIHHDELRSLKPKLRDALADAWRDVLPTLRQQLLSPDFTDKDSRSPKEVLHVWFHLRRDVDSGKTFSEAWNSARATWQNEKKSRGELSKRISRRWSLNQPEEAASWTRTGVGLAGESVSPAGEFAVSPSGDSILTGIYPAGVYSHRISEKDPARLTSRDFKLDGESVVYFRAIGNESSARYVVYDYPRSGVTYPVAALRNEWQWIRQDMSYWDGDSVHLELSASADAPLLAKNIPRSWFGVRDIIVASKSDPAPAEPLEFLDPWFEAHGEKAPASIEAAADSFISTVSDAVKAWSAGTMSDEQALLLDGCMRRGLLPNQPTASSLGMHGDSIRKLLAEYRQLEEGIPVPTRVPGLEEVAGRTQHVYTRGNHKQLGEVAPAGFLAVLNPEPYSTRRSARSQLANDLLRADNPLVCRVIVNRLWHHLFGRGIVATPDNFGRLGHAPTHPELLDHLAVRFANQGHSLKSMIRYMVTSQTWQLTSKPSAEATRLDPDNNWLSHSFVNRLEAEAIRDALLAVSGQLDRTMYGPPVDGGSSRRSVYMRVQRNNLDPFLRAFDFPEPFAAVGRRDVTNVPAQSLTLMNDPRVVSLAAAWANRVLADASASEEARIQQMFEAAFARSADAAEIQRVRRYLAEMSTQYADIAEQVSSIKHRIGQEQAAIRALVEPVRARLTAEAGEADSRRPSIVPKPVSSWDFKEGPKDRLGSADVELRDGAKVENGVLIVNGKGYGVTRSLGTTIREKTLEAWVQLDTLDQQAGGVMTLQSLNGEVFDAIVFAEKSQGEWLAGSNVFARTQAFKGPRETEAVNRAVHLAISYHPDGTIVGYRDGQPYGKSYQSSGPFAFNAKESIISFGVRHLPAGGNRMLRGRILRANLYDRALSGEEVAASSRSLGVISDAQIQAALNDAERKQISDAKDRIAELTRNLEALAPMPETFDAKSGWTDLARAMFTFKEFLFVK